MSGLIAPAAGGRALAREPVPVPVPVPEPELIALDAAVSALDVLVQAQILDLLTRLQDDATRRAALPRV